MSSTRVSISGLSDLKHMLRTELPDATAKRVLKRVLRKQAEKVAVVAIGNVPVGKTHHLRSSIGVGDKLTPYQRRTFRKKDPSDVVMHVGSGRTSGSPKTLPYAHIIEYGSKDHAAQPFMRPAWDAVKGQIVNEIAADIWDEIKRAIARRRK
jgi:HK97 gp10 family phage protein